jgi:hypothetical protein
MESVVLESQASVVSTQEKLGYINHVESESAVVDNDSAVFISLSQVETVLIESPSAQVIVAGVTGPPGKPGVVEDDVPYSKRIDFIDDNNFYKGEAVPGTQETSTLWRISKVEIASDSDVTTTWASGNAEFDKAWSQRLTYTYE